MLALLQLSRLTMRNPIARGTTESFHDVDGTPRRQCRPKERLRQIGRFSQTSAHLGVDLAYCKTTDLL